MAQLTIQVDLSALTTAVNQVIDEKIFPRLNQAVSAVAQQASIDWKEAVFRAKLWSGEKTPYIGSITHSMTGPFSARVESDYKYALEIDTGRPARDLKRMLETSKKVRYVTKGKNKGKRYLIIPFRHNTPGNDAHAMDMPQDVYEMARQLEPSRVTGSKMQHNGGTGARVRVVKRATYAWGGRLPAGLKPKLLPHHATDIYAGMVRMDTSSGNQSSSAYMTFRVMMEGSPKWIVPAKPGLYLVKGVVDKLQPLAERAFVEAVKRDLG
jgi:hypothetical protein